MKLYALTLLALLAFNTASAAPTHHELAEAMITIMNANNMADGDHKFKVCFEDAGSLETGEYESTRVMHKVSVIRRGLEAGNVDKTTYSVITGAYWTVESITRLGGESGVKFECPANSVIEFKSSI